ncbi:MAG: putative metal-dependent hydrolase [Spirosomataceae bacterium]
MDLEKLKYPIGRFERKESYTPGETKTHIQVISAIPSKFINLLNAWSESQLDTSYRPGSWTVRQLVHHVADSHLNFYIRFRLAITEENPTVKPFDENRWAELPDAKSGPVELSLQLLKFTHYRMVLFLNSLSDKDFERTFYNPESALTLRLDSAIAYCAWHGEHHYQQAYQLAVRNGW